MATLDDLLQELRRILDDGDYGDNRSLWSNDQLVGYINRAIDEACLRARLIRDDSTPEICEFFTIPSQSTYQVDRRILEIRRMKAGDQLLQQTNYRTLDLDCPGWEDRVSEKVEQYVLDMDACKVRIVPTPALSLPVKMVVMRTPVRPLSLSHPDACPEISPVHHWNLLDYAAFLALSVHDRDGFDPEISANHEARFTHHFGQRPTAENMKINRHHRHSRVRYHF